MSNEILSGRVEDQIALINDGDDDAIGIVIASTGTVTVQHADGSTEVLSAGDRVYQDDVLTTDDGSSVGIRFADASRFSLGEEGKMQLDDFIYDPLAGTGNSVIDVLQGSFAFVSGMIAKTGDDAMSVNTPVATIGVRGTTVAGDVAPDGQTEVTLLPDTDGTLGEIAVFNDGGLQIMYDAFQRLDVSNAGQAPSAPRTIDPSELREDIADTVRAIGADPTGSSSSRETDGGGSDGAEQTDVEAPTQEGASTEVETKIEATPETELASNLEAPEQGTELPPPVPPVAPPVVAAEPSDAAMEALAEKIARVSPAAGGDRLIVQTTGGKEFEVKPDDATAGGTVIAPGGDTFDISLSALRGLRSFREKLSDEIRSTDDSDFRENRPQLNTETLDFSPEALAELGPLEPGTQLQRPPMEPIGSVADSTTNLDNTVQSLNITDPVAPDSLTEVALIGDPNGPEAPLSLAWTSDGETGLTNHPNDPGAQPESPIDGAVNFEISGLIGSGNDLPDDGSGVV